MPHFPHDAAASNDLILLHFFFLFQHILHHAAGQRLFSRPIIALRSHFILFPFFAPLFLPMYATRRELCLRNKGDHECNRLPTLLGAKEKPRIPSHLNRFYEKCPCASLYSQEV